MNDFFKSLLKRRQEAIDKANEEQNKRRGILKNMPLQFSVVEAGNDYAKLLQTSEWRNKREEILKRDKYRCIKCDNARLLENTDCKLYFEGRQERASLPESWVIRLLDKLDTYELYFQGSLSNLPRNTRLFVKKIDNSYAELVAMATDSTCTILKNLNEIEKIKVYSKNIPYDNNNLDFFMVRGLHVHHHYYIKNKKPWEYINEALIALCEHCHHEFHESNEVKVYENEKMEDFEFRPYCEKCGGSGYLSEYHYHCGGICFNCNGKGIIY